MRIVIPGGSGQVGAVLAREFHASGDEVVVLSRTPRPAAWRTVAWDARTLGDWTREIDGADVVINLAGRSVNCRYTAANRRAIMDSRVESTRVVGEAILKTSRPPRVWLQASTATIYAHRFDAPNDETTGIIGGSEAGAPGTWRFSIDVAMAWERAAEEAVRSLRDRTGCSPRAAVNPWHAGGTRLVLMRSAMVMSPDPGGIFDTLLTLVRRGLGGTAGDGRQYISWVHERDFVRGVRWLIERADLDGPVNIASPFPLPNAEFMRILRQAAGAKLGLPAMRWMLELGALLMRTETELILKSRRVVPGRMMAEGFGFEFPEWGAAAEELCGRRRTMQR